MLLLLHSLGLGDMMDLPDTKSLKTPLHYLCQYGVSIPAIEFLLSEHKRRKVKSRRRSSRNGNWKTYTHQSQIISKTSSSSSSSSLLVLPPHSYPFHSPPHININAMDTHNLTPLHLATHFKNMDAIATLLAHGADPSILDMNGQTAIDYLFTIEGKFSASQRRAVMMMIKASGWTWKRKKNNNRDDYIDQTGSYGRLYRTRPFYQQPQQRQPRSRWISRIISRFSIFKSQSPSLWATLDRRQYAAGYTIVLANIITPSIYNYRNEGVSFFSTLLLLIGVNLIIGRFWIWNRVLLQGATEEGKGDDDGNDHEDERSFVQSDDEEEVDVSLSKSKFWIGILHVAIVILTLESCVLITSSWCKL